MGLLGKGEALARLVHLVHRQRVGLRELAELQLRQELAGCLQLILQVAQLVLQVLPPELAHQEHQDRVGLQERMVLLALVDFQDPLVLQVQVQLVELAELRGLQAVLAQTVVKAQAV